MLQQVLGESLSLQELLPRATRQLASSLSNDDKEVLTYLIAYGRRVIQAIGAPSSTCKSPWKPWKSATKASRKEQVFSSCSFSGSCTESSVPGEEVSSKQRSWLLANHKASPTCDCFSCYSSFWSRWNVSPNRDLINEILEVIEEAPKSSKGKKKKRADKKRAAIVAETSLGKHNGHPTTAQMTCPSGSKEEGVTEILPCIALDSDDSCVVMTTATDRISHSSVMTMDEATHTSCTGRKKSMFRIMKQKEEACVSIFKSPDGDLMSNEVSGALEVDDEALAVPGVVGDRANVMEPAAAIEVSENSTTEASDIMAASISPALSSIKSTPRFHRIMKRRHNQVIPVDCERLLDVEGEQEAAITIENIQAPISPRAADIGLGGRGFLARVFPDALGRVASRLWDLVSVRLRTSTVEYH